jgi:hypothetical protein
MGLIPEGHLTVFDPKMESIRAQTAPGMAHFAGGGPNGATCRVCEFWTGCGRESGYYAKKGMYGGIVKPRPCSRYRDLMGGDVGPGVPHATRACKYFAENKKPPPITRPSA